MEGGPCSPDFGRLSHAWTEKRIPLVLKMHYWIDEHCGPTPMAGEVADDV
jgi:hypothetical protein